MKGKNKWKEEEKEREEKEWKIIRLKEQNKIERKFKEG